jgi:hypothetical protein
MALEELHAADPKGALVADVAPLRGMPLKVLSVRSADYSPLAGMEFDRLDVSDHGGHSLPTLKGVTTRSLRIAVPNTKSLESLKEVHFKALEITTPWALLDLSPLRDCPEMEELNANGCPAPIEPLRGHPTLKRLAYSRPGEPISPLLPVEKFWAEYDAQHPTEGK